MEIPDFHSINASAVLGVKGVSGSLLTDRFGNLYASVGFGGAGAGGNPSYTEGLVCVGTIMNCISKKQPYVTREKLEKSMVGICFEGFIFLVIYGASVQYCPHLLDGPFDVYVLTNSTGVGFQGSIGRNVGISLYRNPDWGWNRGIIDRQSGINSEDILTIANDSR